MGGHEYQIKYLKDPDDTQNLGDDNLVSAGFQKLSRELKLGAVIESEADEYIVHYTVIKIDHQTKPKTAILRKIREMNKTVTIL